MPDVRPALLRRGRISGQVEYSVGKRHFALDCSILILTSFAWLDPFCLALARIGDGFFGDDVARGREDAHRVPAVPEIDSDGDIIGVHKT